MLFTSSGRAVACVAEVWGLATLLNSSEISAKLMPSPIFFLNSTHRDDFTRRVIHPLCYSR